MTRLREELSVHRPSVPTAIAFGVFDGVHLGHQHVLSCLVGAAQLRGLAPVVVTLSNHPLSVLRPGITINMLTSLRERLELLVGSGVAAVAPITFTRDISLLGAHEFMSNLKDCLGLEHFVVGPDVALGHNREGDLATLSAIGDDLGYTVETANQFSIDGMPVRSTAIREALRNCDLYLTERFLGRRFAVDGPVVEGEGRGSGLLGFPTANIGLGPLQALPGDGIYASWITLSDGRRLPAAASVGYKPTFHDEGPIVVEAFILDFDDNLYGEHVRLEFVSRLRDQERFGSVEALAAKINEDVTDTRRVLEID